MALSVAFLRGGLPIAMCGAIYFSNLHNKQACLLACLPFFCLGNPAAWLIIPPCSLIASQNCPLCLQMKPINIDIYSPTTVKLQAVDRSAIQF